MPVELVELLKSPSRLNPAEINLEKIDYRTDVLVIGGGGGGATAALIAADNGAKVLLATKLRLGDSNTIMAEGGIGAATMPEDSPVIHWIDTMMGGRFQNKPDLVEALVTDAPFIVSWLTDLGVNFDRNPDGSFETHMPGGHSRKRSHSVKDLTGLEIMRVLGDEIRNREIDVLEFSPAIELILDQDGQCAGAVLLNLDTDQYIVVRSPDNDCLHRRNGPLASQRFSHVQSLRSHRRRHRDGLPGRREVAASRFCSIPSDRRRLAGTNAGSSHIRGLKGSKCTIGQQQRRHVYLPTGDPGCRGLGHHQGVQ